jgi:hypothetical protein
MLGVWIDRGFYTAHFVSSFLLIVLVGGILATCIDGSFLDLLASFGFVLHLTVLSFSDPVFK